MHRLDHCMCSCDPPAPCTSLQVYKTSIITSGGGVPIHHRLCLHPPLPRGCAEVLPRGASQGARCVYTNCIETVKGAWVTGQNNFWRHGLQNFVQWSPPAISANFTGCRFEGMALSESESASGRVGNSLLLGMYNVKYLISRIFFTEVRTSMTNRSTIERSPRRRCYQRTYL